MLKKLVGLVLIALIIAVVTVVKVIQTYGEFWREAFDAPLWVVLLVLLNIVVGLIVIFVLVKAIAPKNAFAYSVVVALSILTVISTPIAVSTFTGDEVPGKPESVKVSDLYNPLEKIVSDEIDDPVKDAKREEIAAFVTRYEGAGKAGKELLDDRLNESLTAEDVPADEQANLKTRIDAIVEDTSVPYRQRLRRVAQLLFDAEQRDVVKDLAAK